MAEIRAEIWTNKPARAVACIWVFGGRRHRAGGALTLARLTRLVLGATVVAGAAGVALAVAGVVSPVRTTLVTVAAQTAAALTLSLAPVRRRPGKPSGPGRWTETGRRVFPRREVRRRPATRRPAWLARWRPGTADQTATAAPHPAIDETAIIQREPWGRLARGARHPACLSVGRNGPDQSLRKPPVLDPADGLTCHKPGL